MGGGGGGERGGGKKGVILGMGVFDLGGWSLRRAEDRATQIELFDNLVADADAEDGVGAGDAVRHDICWIGGVEGSGEGVECAGEKGAVSGGGGGGGGGDGGRG